MFSTKPAVSKLVDYLSKLQPKQKDDLIRLIDDVRHDDYKSARDLHFKRFCNLAEMSSDKEGHEIERVHSIEHRASNKLAQVRDLQKRGVDVFRGSPNDIAIRILEFVLNG